MLEDSGKSSAIVRTCRLLVATAHAAITHPREGAAQRFARVDDARSEAAQCLVLEHHQPPAAHRRERRKALPVGEPRRAFPRRCRRDDHVGIDRKSTRLNSSHMSISYAVFCLKKKTITILF